MSVPPRSLTLEVWLGPMEGLRYAAEARQAMQLVRIGRLPFDRQSKERNHLVLSVSAGVSGSHAEVRFAQGRIFLRDLGSSNGTFAAQQAVTTETEVKSGEIFLVSLTPVQVYLTSPLAAPPPFEPLPVTHWEGAAVEPLLSAAVACAAGRREGYVDTRHLLDAVLALGDPEIEELLSSGGARPAEVRETLFRKPFFRDAIGWIAEILVKPVNLTGSFETAVVSPRVARLLDGTRTAVPDGVAGDEAVRWAARSVLAGLVADRFGPVGDWLTSCGLTAVPEGFVGEAGARAPAARSAEPELTGRASVKGGVAKGRATTLLTEDVGEATARGGPSPLSRTLPPPPPPPPATSPETSAVAPASVRHREPEPEQRTEAAPAARHEPPREPEPLPAPPPATVAAPFSWGAARTPAEILLDGRARELADELFALAGELRFGTSDDRRRQLKRRVEKELAPLPKESRARFLELLRRHFPVLPAGAGADPEVARLRRRLEESERKRVEESPSKSVERRKPPASAAPSGPLPLKQLVHGEDLAQADRNVVVLRRVIEYALAMEGMTLGLIQSLTMPGNETMAFKLPGFKETLRHFLHAIEQGKPVSVQRVEEYLEELKKWQVAILAAFHQAPGEWFDRLWKRINPVTIESAPRSAGWKLRGEAAEWWDLYKIAVRDLSPDLVNDQILQGVARLSKEELEKLRKTQRGEHS
ncbi:MAG TPA: FHA domain-containing protein [Thermoanaerobaculia bacterium]|nr:FHA domain-containing protein [Thermoanaerobaculia bacterium]